MKTKRTHNKKKTKGRKYRIQTVKDKFSGKIKTIIHENY